MAFLVAGGVHGQVCRFLDAESCLLTSLCILVAGLEDVGIGSKGRQLRICVPDGVG